MRTAKQRAFLKWAGGKYSLVESLQRFLPSGDTLVEPFVGAGSVFLNTNYQRYVLNDINPDLIQLYQIVKQQPTQFIADARSCFVESSNQKDCYLSFRQRFNQSQDRYERAVLFLYLNRHGYNGLCRYNLKGIFNVPFGSYKKPYFPEAELNFFAEKAQQAEFRCSSYQDIFASLPKDAVVYCDPPYVPLSKTASFTSYARQGFNLDDQANLANLAEQACAAGSPVLISNHDTTLTRKLYQQARLHSLQVARFISQNGKGRQKVGELFALYTPTADVVSVVPRIRSASQPVRKAQP
ncbi:Dam family site-specific DNA-(adenine-N6)-methyltransferase [Alkalimonas delamerensis]|uniref:Site-specific DNA-methyltransferase (adenine-specific) n=1 Tax=Alkalimonas delamerensis TaxID=265981 RepID=A0ABT9GLN8_9GAMM|nr:Dam family site-specific DNA-(adenine-N6)-methyltransferase [Alkalimonas delamerensis]MDP4527882.1 Dam family site-specific DNA-(adenine-N6)-methyltransferase [Alkalimonas delamerensis]